MSDPKLGAARAWLLQSPPGLATILKKEMVFAGILERKQDVFIKRQRNHDLIFLNRLKNDENVPRLRVAEAAYRCPAFGRFKISKRQLDVIAEELRTLGPRRLVTQVTGRHFDRRDLGRWLEKELISRDSSFSSDIEDEVWMICIDEAFYFGIPAFKSRHAEGRSDRVERIASLPPSTAAALVFAGMPRNDDVIFDPVCGSGTLLAEARVYAPSATFLGCDIDPEAVKTARANLGSSIRIVCEDSTRFDLQRKDLSLVVANLPFGKQYGDTKTNVSLYQGLLKNSLRFANLNRFRAILLTSDTDALRATLAAFPELEVKEMFRVKIRGIRATAVSAKPK